MDDVIYCPICGRNLYATNRVEVEAGEDDSFIFIHDEIPHDDSDIQALGYGIN